MADIVLPRASIGGTLPVKEPVAPPVYPFHDDDPIVEIFRRFQFQNQAGISLVSENEVTQDKEGLKQLMKRGAWKSTMSLVDKFLASTKYPHQKLIFKVCRTLSLIKMRLYTNAQSELDSIGGVDDDENQFETYPELYNDKKGSMVPDFTIRLLGCELKYLLKKDIALESFQALRLYCKEKRMACEVSQTPDGHGTKTPSGKYNEQFETFNIESDQIDHTSIDDIFVSSQAKETAQIWRSRENRLLFSMLSKFLQQRDFLASLALLEDVYLQYPEDLTVLYLIGRVYSQMGYIEAAIQMTAKLQSIEPKGVRATMLQYDIIPFISTNITGAYIEIAKEDYVQAIDCFDQVLAIPEYARYLPAINNKALCYMFLKNVNKTIEILEAELFEHPETALSETIVSNLCIMYDLALEKSLDKRKKLLQLVKDRAPDSFDLSTLKLPNTIVNQVLSYLGVSVPVSPPQTPNRTQ